MGRHHSSSYSSSSHPHHLKLPDHLYLSPPSLPLPPSNTLTSFLSVRSAAALQATSSAVAVGGDKIPGFKASAAFLTTLRANLNLESDSAPNSLTTTPDSLRPVNMTSSTGSLPPPSPSPLAQQSQDQDMSTEEVSASNSIPDLSTTLASTDDDRVEALKLVADSVAQQRQLGSRAVMFHPITFAIDALLLGLIYQYIYKGSQSDWAVIGTTFAGVLMSTLITIRWLSGAYIEEAERVGTWAWLDLGRADNPKEIVGASDEVFLTRFGDEVIGALIMRGVKGDGLATTNRSSPSTSTSTATSTSTSTSTSSSSPRKRNDTSSSKNQPTKALIRAWTVKQRYRHKGVGTALLEDAVRHSQTQKWQGPEFAVDHANSARVLPVVFNGRFDRKDRLARELLERVKTDAGVPVAGSLNSNSSGSGSKKRR